MMRKDSKIPNERGDVLSVNTIQTRIAKRQAATLSNIRALVQTLSLTSRKAPKLTREYTRSEAALPSAATVVRERKLTISNASTAEIVKPRVHCSAKRSWAGPEALVEIRVMSDY